MRIRFLEIAEIEVDEAIQYYNCEAAGLCNDFLSEVLNAPDRIAKFPEDGIPAQKERDGVEYAGFHTESSTRYKRGNTSYRDCQPAQRA